MKKIFLLMIMLMVSSISIAQDFNIFGKWKAIDPDGEDIFLTFDKMRFIYISNGIETYGGKAVDMGDGLKLDFTYEINMENEPFSLDIVMHDINDRSTRLIKRGYFKIINKNTIALKQELFSDDNTWYEDLTELTFKRQN